MDNDSPLPEENRETEIEKIKNKYSAGKIKEKTIEPTPVGTKNNKKVIGLIGLVVVVIIGYLFIDNLPPIIFGGEVTFIDRYQPVDTVRVDEANELERIILDAEITSPDKSKDQDSVKSDYTLELNSSEHLIYISPKKGTWDKPFIGIPAEERKAVSPEISPKNEEADIETEGEFYFTDSVKVFGVIAESPEASAAMPYGIHYKKLPKTIYFGDWGKPLVILKLK